MFEVQVEFFGIARQLAGCESAQVEARVLADVISRISLRFPELAARCFDDGAVRPNWIFNVDGRFVRDSSFPVSPQISILLMSADAGG